MEPLQTFDFRSSRYERPNQEWICGWAREGRACPLGPDTRGHCRATSECRPVDRAGRWECTRSEVAGGRCADGPLPDGRCAHAIIRCRPLRSMKGRRRAVARWAAVVTLGLLVFVLGRGFWAPLIDPGPLSPAHAGIADCRTCHAAAEGGPMGWLPAAFGGALAHRSGSRSCLECHAVGKTPLAPHGLPAAQLASMREAATARTSGSAPLALKAARMITPETPTQLQCATCHREHGGGLATSVSAGRCQVCHAAAFESLAHGHPEFARYPAKRRTRINFDHAAHIGKHFPEKVDLKPPGKCTDCHDPEPGGRLMAVKTFEATCASCHAVDVEGTKRSDARGLAFLQLPGLDLEALGKRRVPIGDWPEYAEARISPLTDLLLSSESAYRSARARLLKTDLTDLPDSQHDADVQVLVWSIKTVVDDLRTGGALAWQRRLESVLGAPLAPEQRRALTGQLPAAAVDEIQREWFPRLAEDLRKHRGDSAAPLHVVRAARAQVRAPEAKPQKQASGDFDKLFAGGGLLGAEEKEKASGEGPDVPAAQAQKRAASSAEERMASGGWYRDEDALRYRPGGHRDGFMRAWLDAAAGSPAFDALSDPKKIAGACTKCHSIDAASGGQTLVNWSPARGDPKQHSFTVFSHVKHFSMLGEKGCSTCHTLDRKADYAAAFAARDPNRFASNFANIRRETCVECHTPAMAGDDCTRCHRYHVGEFSPTLPAAALERMSRPASKH